VGKAMTADGKLLESFNLGQLTLTCTPEGPADVPC
jgi:hypothetical protein